MNFTALIGAFIVTFSLLSYGIGMISLQRFKLITPLVLIFLSLGVILDITATIFMVIGAKSSPFSVHGFIGYSGLMVMLIVVVLLWKAYMVEKKETLVNKNTLKYSKIAYAWWIIAYIAGSLTILGR